MEIAKEELTQIKELLRKNPRGMNVTEIAKELDLSRVTAARYLDMLVLTGYVDLKEWGPSKVYFLSQRMPISAMLSLSSDFIIVLDKNRNIINVNDRFLEFAGTSREEILYKKIQIFAIPSMFKPSFIPRIKEAIEGKESVVETIYERNGKINYFNVKLIPIVFDEGDTGVTILIEDITERKRIERAIRESEEKFRSVIEQSRDGIMLIDNDGTIIECSKGVESISGMSLGTNIGKKIWETGFITNVTGEYNSDYRTQEGLNNLKKFIIEYVRTGVSPLGINSFELTFTRPDKEKRVVLFNYSPIRSEKGNMICMIARDITERKMAEIELIKSESALTRAQKMAHLGSWETDLATRTTKGSEEYYRLYGQDPKTGSHTYESFLESVHPDDRERLENTFDDALCKDKTYVIDFRIILPDGTMRYIHSESEVMCNDDGQPIKLFGISWDITEIKKAEELIRERENRLKTILDISPVPMIVTDGMRRKTVYLNEKFTETFGYTIEDVPGPSEWFHLAFPDEKYRAYIMENWFLHIDGSPKAKSSRISKEATVCCKDGSKRVIITSTSSIDEMTVIIFHDVTERKHAEERYRNLVESVSDIIWETDANLIFSYINPQIYEILGRKPEEIVGKTPLDFMDHDEGVRLSNSLLPQMMSRKPFDRQTFRLVSNKGKIFSIELSGTPIFNANGQFEGYRGVARDVSEEKQKTKP